MTKKRRNYSTEFKFDTVMEAVRGEKSKAQICRDRDITESLLYRWQQEFLEKAPTLFAEGNSTATADREKEAQIAELERMVGRLTMELDVLKKSTSWLRSQRRRNG